MSITMTDLFCGAGGSGLGAAAAGVELTMAANHSPRAIETHQANFPNTAHDCADLSQVQPRRYRPSTLLWASPECTNHSQAQGRRRDSQPALFGDAPDPVGERSRATMWDVPRFAEVHQYQAIVVENVVDAVKWPPFTAWLAAMDALGYHHRVVSLNSMHAPARQAPRAPQSRDRMYVVFWRAGNTPPDLDLRPSAWCESCESTVAAVQSWRNGARVGRYRQQYDYRCPHPACRHQLVEPHTLPAAAAIDWTHPGQRIGDRAKPLAVNTLARIEAGLDRYARPQPVQARTPRQRYGVAFVAELRGGGSTARHVASPLSTVTAAGTHHMLVRNNTSKGAGGDMCTPAQQPARTVTTSGNQSLVGWPHQRPAVEDCTFRMLTVPEIQAAMAFTPEYRLTGTKREQVAQLGNGVTPPAAEWLLTAVVDSLEGTHPPARPVAA